MQAAEIIGNEMHKLKKKNLLRIILLIRYGKCTHYDFIIWNGNSLIFQKRKFREKNEAILKGEG